MNKKNSVLGIVLKVLAVIFFVMFLFSIYYAHDYISGLNGVTFTGYWKEILMIYIGQCAVPFISFIVCYVLSVVVEKLANIEFALTANTVSNEVAQTVIEETMISDDTSDEEFIAELKEEPAK